MRKQLMTIFAGLLLMFTLTAVAPAQSGNCRLNEDGTSKCGDPPPPVRPGPTSPATSTMFANNGANLWYAMLTWAGKF